LGACLGLLSTQTAPRERFEEESSRAVYIEAEYVYRKMRKLSTTIFEIVPGLVESGGSRRTARYATWTC
jgi:hypothetical protein